MDNMSGIKENKKGYSWAQSFVWAELKWSQWHIQVFILSGQEGVDENQQKRAFFDENAKQRVNCLRMLKLHGPIFQKE